MCYNSTIANKEHKMLKNLTKDIKEVEDGFSLLELVVAAGISISLAGLALTTLLPAAQTITNNLKEAQMIQEANAQAEADFINSMIP